MERKKERYRESWCSYLANCALLSSVTVVAVAAADDDDADDDVAVVAEANAEDGETESCG